MEVAVISSSVWAIVASFLATRDLFRFACVSRILRAATRLSTAWERVDLVADESRGQYLIPPEAWLAFFQPKCLRLPADELPLVGDDYASRKAWPSIFARLQELETCLSYSNRLIDMLMLLPAPSMKLVRLRITVRCTWLFESGRYTDRTRFFQWLRQCPSLQSLHLDELAIDCLKDAEYQELLQLPFHGWSSSEEMTSFNSGQMLGRFAHTLQEIAFHPNRHHCREELKVLGTFRCLRSLRLLSTIADLPEESVRALLQCSHLQSLTLRTLVHHSAHTDWVRQLPIVEWHTSLPPIEYWACLPRLRFLHLSATDAKQLRALSQQPALLSRLEEFHVNGPWTDAHDCVSPGLEAVAQMQSLRRLSWCCPLKAASSTRGQERQLEQRLFAQLARLPRLTYVCLRDFHNAHAMVTHWRAVVSLPHVECLVSEACDESAALELIAYAQAALPNLTCLDLSVWQRSASKNLKRALGKWHVDRGVKVILDAQTLRF